MDEQQRRLVNCFCAVFPELSEEEITQASSATVPSWDSVAVVTLFAVIEEEFGISIEEDDPARFESFQQFLSYLQESERKRQRTSDVG
ncbi:MAG: acyl carrier protein [Candidatus Acidiferrum sp.]